MPNPNPAGLSIFWEFGLLRRARAIPAALTPCLVLALSLISALEPSSSFAAEPGEAIELRVTQRKLNPESPQQKRIDSLAWRGGLEINSPERDFGGLSGLYLDADGQRLVLLTDEGNWLTGTLSYDENGWLTGVDAARMGRLKDERGNPLSRRPIRQDSEALARQEDGGWLVTFEQLHRIRKYPPGPVPDGTAESIEIPGDLPRGSNEALEALTVLPDGRLVTLREGAVSLVGQNAVFRGYIYQDETWQAFDYIRPKPTKPTDIALGPDGMLYVAERHWSPVGGLTIRVARFDPKQLAPGAAIKAETLATMRPPLTIDNFEGIYLRKGPKGEILVYLVSDDNFSAIQRTLLVMFEVLSE